MTITNETTSTELHAATGLETATGVKPRDLENVLRNVALFTSTDKTLPLLTAVQIIPGEDGKSLVARATDRYTLAAGHVVLDEDGTVSDEFAALVSNADVKPLTTWLKSLHENDRVTITMDREASRITFNSTFMGTGQTYMTLDGEFPKIGRLFNADRDLTSKPDDMTPPVFGLNPKYLARLGKVKDWRGGTGRNEPMVVRPDGHKPMTVLFGDWLAILVMPVRLGVHASEGATLTVPGWVSGR